MIIDDERADIADENPFSLDKHDKDKLQKIN
jgi:hypothetical protein